MSDKLEPKDPAEVLKKHFTTLQSQESGENPRYVMSERNRIKLEKIREKVRQMRGG